MTLTTDIRQELERANVDYDLIDHRRTERAVDEARAIGIPPEQVAKTIVIVSEDAYVRVVVAASDHVDMHKIRELLGDKQARLANETELVVAYPMYELGAVPPFGVPAGDRVLFDRRLAERDSVVVEAGSHHESLRMKTKDLIKLTTAELADVALRA